MQALQSQWNLFSSIRLSRSNLNNNNNSDLEDDLDSNSESVLDENGNRKKLN